MKNFYFLLGLIPSLILCSCTKPKPENPIKQIEQAHNKNKFMTKDVVRFSLRLVFGEKEYLNAKFSLKTNSSKGRIDLSNGDRIYTSEDKVYCSPNMTDSAKVRFDAFTWSYFFLLPYKLSDEGTIWSDFSEKKYGEHTFKVQKLSFSSGTGDSPNDWYLIHTNPQTRLIDHTAYIVSFKMTKEEAQKRPPGSLTYTHYQKVDGIPVAHTWVSRKWNAERGLGDIKGEGFISDIEFISENDTLFDVPKDFIEVKL